MVIKVEDAQSLKKVLAERPLVLYGMGTIGMEIAGWCDSNGIDYIFADRNAQEKQGLTERLVVPPKELAKSYKSANVVVSTNIYFDEIKASLIESGFGENQILSYALFVPKNIVWTDLEDNINWELMRPSVELLSKWIGEDITSVADFGAGQMYLKRFLRPSVKYYPIDYMKRFEETIVSDLNTGDFPDIEADLSVFNGVLEFLTTAGELLNYACGRTAKSIIISYMTADRFSSITARRASGYVSDLTEQEIIETLREGGFNLIKKEHDPLDDTDTIYLFQR